MSVITGKVIDMTGKPLYNATVVFTDKNGKAYSPLMGTVTDFNGRYSFDTLGGYYLRVSSIGYKTMLQPVLLKNFQAGGAYIQVINFALPKTAYQLPEVVIHGGVKKSWWDRNRHYAWLTFGLVAIGYAVKKNSQQ